MSCISQWKRPTATVANPTTIRSWRQHVTDCRRNF